MQVLEMRVLLILGCVVAAVSAQNASAPCADACYGDYVPDPTSCCYYYQCVGPNQYRMPCPEGLHFNSKLKVCDWPWRANCTTGEGGGGGTVTSPPGGIKPPCTSMDVETLPYENDCSKYYYCENGYPYVVQCNDSYAYDPEKHSCEFNSSCSGGVVTPAPGGIIPPCTSMDVATLPYENDCSKYYYCHNGYPYVVQCNDSYAYDAAKHSCEFNSSCSGGVVTPAPGGVVAPCTSKQPATLPYENNCTLYYYCYEGYPFITECNKGEYFSAADHKCITATECPSGGGGTGGSGGGGGGTIDFKCPDQYGTYAYPNDTTKYYYCYNYVTYIAECNKNQTYVSSMNRCN